MADCICPTVNDADWQDREHRWVERYFYRQSLRYFFGLPVQAHRRVQQVWSTLESRDYTLTEPVQILFAQARFRGAVLVGIERPTDDSRLSIRCFREAYWYSRVCPGPLGQALAGARQLKKDLAARGKNVCELYYWCITCPHCRPEKGGDRVVLLARIK